MENIEEGTDVSSQGKNSSNLNKDTLNQSTDIQSQSKHDSNQGKKASSQGHTHCTIKWWLRLAAIFCIILAWWHVFRPNNFHEVLSATCQVDACVWYEVTDRRGDTLRLAVSDGHTTDAMGRIAYADTTSASGAFVSACGHLVAPATVFLAADSLTPDTLRALLSRERQRLHALAKEQKEAVKELEYYARTHSVADDGYNEVMRYGTLTAARMKNADSLAAVIDTMLAGYSARARLHRTITVKTVRAEKWRGANRVQVLLQHTEAKYLRGNKNLVLLQTDNHRLPQGAAYISLFTSGEERKYDMGFPKQKILPDLIPDSICQAFPKNATEGLLTIDGQGRAVAMQSGGKACNWNEVRTLCLQGNQLSWLVTNAGRTLLRALFPANKPHHATRLLMNEWPQNVGPRFADRRFYQLRRDTLGTYAGRFTNKQANGFGLRIYRNKSSYLGLFEKNIRQGHGQYTDSLQRIYTGVWQSDSLPQGCCQDSTHFYVGNFNAKLQRQGFGVCHEFGRSYYSGAWDADKRHGFGFSVGERHMIRAGIWKRNVFRGEQMVYTADRVYGIDISRYQHEIGRKRYSINWPQLRITRLGAANASRIRGSQNYPVTFVYVKATEGTSSFNRYYAADIAAARRRGLRTGAYHFFSTRTPGAAQARHFLKMAKLRRGDLPPVLDVEPSDAQIAAMGGRQALYREMTAWLRVVKNYCGTMPVLYISQGFVNKYMARAPASLSRYQVWIARYGEYKPYVHLLYWQLSPYGRVAGIQGEVDINVFNGSRKQFQRFAAANGVK